MFCYRAITLSLLLLISSSIYGQALNEAVYGRNTPICTSAEKLNYNGTAFVCEAISAGSIPTGSILLIATGTCPTGFVEATELNGVALVGTLAANGNVGTTGGNDNIIPAGLVNELLFTGTPSGDVVNHVHTITAGTGSTGNFTQVTTAVDTSSGGTGGTPTQTTLGTRTVATEFGVKSYIPAGFINFPLFTGTSFDNRGAFKYVIFCRKS